MTKYLSSLLLALALAGCATSSGQPAARVAPAAIASAYLPLHATTALGLESADGAGVIVAPGIAATNGHNRNLVDPAAVIGEARDYDLLFFRVPAGRPPETAEPVPGAAVTAYGQGIDAELRIAHGTVRKIVTCPGCGAPAYFTFSNGGSNETRSKGDAGPGFSGGPVVDGSGRLAGIVFGYKDEGKERFIYAYDMARVAAELIRIESLTPRKKQAP